MASLGSFTLASGCDCCNEPYLIVGECQSRTGTATLYGFSGYSSDTAPYDPIDPWAWEGQLRKWRDKSLTVDFSAGDTVTTYVSGCSGAVASTEHRYRNITGSGTQTLTSSGCTPAGELTFDAWTGPEGPVALDCPDTIAAIFLARTDSPSITGTVATSQGYTGLTEVVGTYTRTLTTETLSIAGTDSDCATYIRSDLSILHSGDGALLEEQSWYDALEDDPDVIDGDGCCASTDEADLTTPESTASISATLTAVRIPLTAFGCSPVGSIVGVNITVTQGEDEFVISTAIRCGVASFFQMPQPAPGEDPICFVSAALA